MHRLRIRSLAVLLAGFIAGAVLGAQQPDAPRTHVVKKGDTLWDLAHTYLGDAFLWPEIYRLNTDKIEDPHWIYPGEALKLPASGALLGKAPANNGAAAATSVSNPTASPAVAQRQQQPRRLTVFSPDANKVDRKARESLNLRERANAVRTGEFLASPFVWMPGGPGDHGVVEEAAEAVGISMTTANRPIQYLEPVFVHLPNNTPGRVGDQYLVYRLDSLIETQGQVLVPTGVLTLISRGANGRSRAQLTKKFEDVFQGQHVMPLDSLHQNSGEVPARVEFGMATRVSWLDYNPVLPGSGSYLILTANSKDGITPGDQVTLLRSRGEDSKGVELPDEEVAVAQVTRVTPYGAAAIVLRTLQAGVALGMKARVTAKMP
jgi:LysM repeat protein